MNDDQILCVFRPCAVCGEELLTLLYTRRPTYCDKHRPDPWADPNVDRVLSAIRPQAIIGRDD